MTRTPRTIACLFACGLTVGLARAQTPGPGPGPEVRAALDRVSADSLKGHVSFLASDLLEGRGTPSRGLDVAAEYIASQFRRAGLEPVGDDGYFQTAPWKCATDPSEFSLVVRAGGKSISVGFGQVEGSTSKALTLRNAATVKVDAADAEAVKALKPEAVAGKVVLTSTPRTQAGAGALVRLAALRAALILDLGPDGPPGDGPRRNLGGRSRFFEGTTVLRVASSRLLDAWKALPAGPTEAVADVEIGEPKEREAKVRNVVGLLRGSDPKLKNTYVLVTAHYDHLGIVPDASGDVIRNGANDDASGTAAVMEIAQALSTLAVRPKRSVVFLTFYGEEHGLVGSRYYGEHPVVPLDKTVAAINLEQVGRTDDSEGPRVAGANVTGFDYSDVGAILKAAGDSVGVEIAKHPVNSDRYFFASDNAALARVGIPAHTLSVAYMFPDYHGAKDEWPKLDFANMTKVVRTAALAVHRIADSAVAPKWDAANPKTKPYRDKAPGR